MYKHQTKKKAIEKRWVEKVSDEERKWQGVDAVEKKMGFLDFDVWKSVACTFQVVIYSSDLTNLHNITGEQIGAYFGYALCVLDVDGDGLDDIVVGSPMYTDFHDPAMKIETGRVYVIYQTKRVCHALFDFIQHIIYHNNNENVKPNTFCYNRKLKMFQIV